MSDDVRLRKGLGKRWPREMHVGRKKSKYLGCTMTFVPFLKYTWGTCVYSCPLRLLPPFIFPGRSVTSNAILRARNEEDWRSQGWLQAWETGLCPPTLLPSIISLLLQMLRLFIKSWNWARELVHLLFSKRRGIPHQSILWSQATRASLLFLDTPDTSQRSSSRTNQASWLKWPNSPYIYIYQSTCHLYTIICL